MGQICKSLAVALVRRLKFKLDYLHSVEDVQDDLHEMDVVLFN